jgi:tetratricopeptide (TPR) repeat protein
MVQLKVFLSHSSQDKAFADTLAQALRGAGADVWYDEESLGAGHLRRIIMKELADRPVFVVLLSKPAQASTWVLDECEWAFDLQRDDPSRIMLPVVVQQLEKAELGVALYLRSLKRVEAGDLRPLPVAEAATQAMRLLGLAPKGQAPTPATPQPAESADDLVTRAKALTAQKQYAQAIPLFERATQLAPDNEDAWFNLGYVHNRTQQWQQALSAFDRALALKPHVATTWANKGLVLQKLGRYQEALEADDRAISLKPDLAEAWDNKAVVLFNLRRYQEALQAAERAIGLKHDLVSPWTTKGAALYMLALFNDALLAYDTALRLDGNNRNCWGGKVMTLRALGRKAEADEADRRAKELGG